MSRFVKFKSYLTGNEIYINTKMVEGVWTNIDRTTIIKLNGNEGGYHVQESVEDVLAMIQASTDENSNMRPQGRWKTISLKDDNGKEYACGFVCSECGAARPAMFDDFCPCCGADMRGSEENDDES